MKKRYEKATRLSGLTPFSGEIEVDESDFGVLIDAYEHPRIHHHTDEFAREKNDVNGIKSFWSSAKARITQLQGIRRVRFFIHLKECEWRWNHRNDKPYKILFSNFRKFPLSTT